MFQATKPSEMKKSTAPIITSQRVAGSVNEQSAMSVSTPV